jgi:hypothetical protein
MGDTVKIKLEIGSAELSYEGPASFAREELLELVGGLVDRLASYEIDIEDFEPLATDDEPEGEEDDIAEELVTHRGH